MFDEYTVLFLAIENLNKDGDIMLYRQGCRIFKSKEQYKAIYGRAPGYEAIEHNIPPDIKESGALFFEPLGPYCSGEAKIRIQFLGKQNLEFMFPIKV